MTAQQREKLIVEGKLEDLAVLPLGTHPVGCSFDFHALGTHRSTSCWRGYVAVWELHQGRLWLVGLFDADYVPMDTRPVFGEAPLPLPADWFTGTLVLPRGERLAYVHMGFGGDYAEELRLYLRQGVVERRRRLNRRPRFRGMFIDEPADEARLHERLRLPPGDLGPLWWLTPAGAQVLGLDASEVHADWLWMHGGPQTAQDAAEQAESAAWDAELMAKCRRAPALPPA